LKKRKEAMQKQETRITTAEWEIERQKAWVAFAGIGYRGTASYNAAASAADEFLKQWETRFPRPNRD